MSAATALPATAHVPKPLDVLSKLSHWLIVLFPVFFVIGITPAEIALIVVCVTFLLRSAWLRDAAPFRQTWFLLAVAIWLYLMAIAPFSTDWKHALEAGFVFIRYPVFALALSCWIWRDDLWRCRFAWTSGAMVFYVALECIIQLYSGTSIFGEPWHDEFRLTGPFPNHVPGTFMAKTFFVFWSAALVVSLKTGRKDYLIATLAAPLVIAGAIVLTGERMAFATFGLGLTVAALLIAPLRRWAILGGVLVVALGAFTVTTSDRLANHVIPNTVNDLSNFWEGRYGIIFRQGFAIWETQPLTGVGLRNFRVLCEDDEAYSYLGPRPVRCMTHPHNIYIEWLSETGIVGFTGFLALIVLWSRELILGIRTIGPPERYGLLAATCGLLVFLWPFQSGMSFITNWNAVLFWSLLAWAFTWTQRPPRAKG